MLLNIGKAKLNEGKPFVFECKVPIDDSLLQDRGYSTKADASVRGEYLYKSETLMLKAQVEVKLSCFCDNCGKAIEKSISFDMAEEFIEDYNSNSSEDYTIHQITVDLDRPVADNLLFNIPSRILCKQDCKGLCSVCGKDKNLYSCNCEQIALEEQKLEQNPFNKLKNRR